MRFPRGSGILLHPTSLPGEFGIGDLGPEAYRFVDLLADAGQRYWQILPLGPTGYGDSPYQAFSAFAGNTLLISPEALAADGLVTSGELQAARTPASDRVDHGKVHDSKANLLNSAFDTFQAHPEKIFADEFATFCRENAFWLDDYALYRVLKATNGQQPWYKWPDALKMREAGALAFASDKFSDEIHAQKFFQYIFFRQWLELKNYANERGISVIGDLPIFLALDSADVWCNQSKFKLNPDGSARFVAGVPPDYFSKTGQLWGNPVYDWDEMDADAYRWWTARVAFTLSTVDIARLDHFIGFVRAWEVPATDETAENGQWVAGPGAALFSAMIKYLGKLPVIAEDLGSITPEVEALRDQFGFPGMRILQYAFGGNSANRDLPHNYPPNSVAYTGTHDNDTIAGWFAATGSKVRTHCRRYLRIHREDVHWALVRGVMASVADIAIIPAQDILGLGSEARMNTPATAGGNWQWRLTDGQIAADICAKLRQLTELYGRH